MIHHPILQGVKGDHTDPSPNLEQVYRRLKRLLQPLELLIDGDADRLKGARRRMDTAGPEAPRASRASQPPTVPAHAHIQRPLHAEANPPTRIRELQRRDPQITEDPVD